MEPAVKSHLSLTEYNELEEENNTRYEYHGGPYGYGEVFAMAGGEPKHGAIAGTIIRLLGNALSSKDCTVFTSDVKFHIASENKSCYPDVSVVCGPAERSEQDTRALTNPILLVEVISESTAAYDRGQKFHTYSQLPSLREYVLVEQDMWRIQTYFRNSPADLWQMQWFSGENSEVILRSIGISLSLSELYRRTEGL